MNEDKKPGINPLLILAFSTGAVLPLLNLTI